MAKKKKYLYQLFWMEPPILKLKKPFIHDFKSTDWDAANNIAKEFIKDKKEGTVILMLAQLNR